MSELPAQPAPASKDRMRSLLRAALAVCLAAAVSFLLPANRNAVVRQQIVQEVPHLAAGLGDGPWSLAGGADAVFRSAFQEARRRRVTHVGGGPPVVFTCRKEPGGIHLVAAAGPSGSHRIFLREIDGWSLFPPVVAILIAVFSGRLILGLSIAVLAGGFISVSPALTALQIPLEAFRKAAIDYVWSPLESSFQLYILAFTAALIGMVRVTSLSGGNTGIADLLAGRAEGARSARLTAFLLGLAIFFDDYANTIVVGTTMRPIADRFRVSREKLSYIVDATAAPVAGIAVISTWIGFEVGLFDDLMRQLHTGVSGYQLFFRALSTRFYCLFTLVFVAVSTWFRRDFGPMYRAERRAQTTGQVLRPGATPLIGRRNEEVAPVEGVPPAWWAAALPVCTVVLGVVLGMALDTWHAPAVLAIRLRESVFSLAYWTACFSRGDNAKVLFIASLIGSVLAVVIALTRRNPDTGARPIRLSEALSTYARGIAGVYYALVILILAWAIKEVCTDAGTSVYLTAALSPYLSPGLLPVLLFGLAALISFAIGTSWTTMAILIPTAVPLAYAMGGLPLTVLASAAVLDGAIFGDHCSPISDTTVMSSIASSCDHIDHVKTQLPYALATLAVAGTVGYLGTAELYAPWVALGLGTLCIAALLFAFGRNPDAPPERASVPAERP